MAAPQIAAAVVAATKNITCHKGGMAHDRADADDEAVSSNKK